MVRETWIQSQVESYQRLNKWYLMSPVLLNTQHYKVRIKGKWSNPGKGVAPPLPVILVAIEKGTFGSPSARVAN